MQQFFIDTIHFLLKNINNDNKLIDKYTICTTTSDKLLQLINDHKNEPSDDLCITLVSRLFLLFNTLNNDDLLNQPNIKVYITNKFDYINTNIISILNDETSIYSDNVIEQDTKTRKLETSLQKSFDFEFFKERVTENLNGELSKILAGVDLLTNIAVEKELQELLIIIVIYPLISLLFIS